MPEHVVMRTIYKICGISAVLVAIALIGLASNGAYAQKAASKASLPPINEILSERVLGKADAPVTVIEYASMTCPHCDGKIDVFKKGGGKKLAEELVLPYLGSIPLDGEIVANSDSGEPVVLSCPDSEAAKAFMRLADNCHKFLNPE